LDIDFDPGNTYFASGNAAIEPMMTLLTVPAAVRNTVLNKYLDIGIQELPIMMNKSWKFVSVGLCTNSFGGNIKISFNGLNALLIMNTSGQTLNNPNRPRKSVSEASPRMLLFRRLNFLDIYTFLMANGRLFT